MNGLPLSLSSVLFAIYISQLVFWHLFVGDLYPRRIAISHDCHRVSPGLSE